MQVVIDIPEETYKTISEWKEPNPKYAAEYMLYGFVKNGKQIEQEPCSDAISKEQLLKYLKDNSEDFPDYHEAIEYVLSMPSVMPQPCSDAISRTAALNTLDTMDKALDENRTVEEYKELLRECYEQLPSVSVSEKTGRWIYDRRRDWDGECKYECSECGMGSDVNFPYCMRCGTKMGVAE